MTDSAPEMTVDVWADIVCPWCCLGKAYLEHALAGFEHADDVDVRWHSFEHDPNAPAIRPASIAKAVVCSTPSRSRER